MAKTKKEELKGTKAILFADGNANKFQEFKGEPLYKEHLQESDYAESKSVHTSESLSLNKGESNDVVTINDHQVSMIVFEDGSVYDIGKGFRANVSDKVQAEIKSATPKPVAAKKADVTKTKAEAKPQASGEAKAVSVSIKPNAKTIVEEVKPVVETK